MRKNLETKTTEIDFEIETFQFSKGKYENLFLRKISDFYRKLCDNIFYYTGW